MCPSNPVGRKLPNGSATPRARGPPTSLSPSACSKSYILIGSLPPPATKPPRAAGGGGRGTIAPRRSSPTKTSACAKMYRGDGRGTRCTVKTSGRRSRRRRGPSRRPTSS
eukprot:426038-Prymnesium_polylepis.2